ncbi:MAG: DUF1735 domain-containing protein [Saprospiraceae bacterium]
MKNIINLLAIVLMISATSCLRDEPITDYTDAAIKPIVLIPNGNWPSVQKANPIAFDFKTTGQDIDLYARVSWVRPLDKDITVNFAKDASIITAYNAALGTNYVELSAGAYTLPTLAVVIPAGKLEAKVTIKVFADKVDLTKNNMLAFKIVDAGDQPIASNFRQMVFPVLVKNIYEANYNVTGYFFHPSAPRSINAAKYMATISGDRVEGQLGDLGGWFFQVQITNESKLTSFISNGATPAPPAAGLMTIDNGAGIPTYPGPGGFDHATYPNDYNATTKTFRIHYGYATGAAGEKEYTRQMYEKWVRQ